MKDYEKLRELLKTQEKFPLQFTHKFIGRNSQRFTKGIEAFEKQFPKLALQSARTSSGDAHLAMTYVFEAGSADEIILVLQETAKIEDVLIVL